MLDNVSDRAQLRTIGASGISFERMGGVGRGTSSDKDAPTRPGEEGVKRAHSRTISKNLDEMAKMGSKFG